MIQDNTVREAIAALDAVAAGRWPLARAELQDDGTFLLLSVDAEVPRATFDEELREGVARQLNSIVPASPEQMPGSWMVVFKTGGNVYQSLLPSAL